MQINKIYNEDCLATMGRMENAVIDLTVTSPPYDTMRAYNGFSFNVNNVSQELYRVTKPGGVVVWVVADMTVQGSESGSSFRQALTFLENGFNLFDTMIYLKPPRGATGSNKTYWQGFEYMFVFSKGTPKTINLILDRRNQESRMGDRSTKRLKDGTLKKVFRAGYGNYGRRTNVWQYSVGKGHSSKDEEAFEHPAIFPEKLAHDHIYSWSNQGDLVYDCFMGSGTTAKMAYLLKRKFIGSEISNDYCLIANCRLKRCRCEGDFIT